MALAGAVCAGTRFEGLLWGEVTRDGLDATERLVAMLESSKFTAQLHAILLDGLAFGGFNLVDIQTLHRTCQLPVLAVMRRPPDLVKFHEALAHLPDLALRRAHVVAAGPIHTAPPFVFQCAGTDPAAAADLLRRVTDTGRVPEALRLAHLIGSAVITGQSGRRA